MAIRLAGAAPFAPLVFHFRASRETSCNSSIACMIPQELIHHDSIAVEINKR
jgi:hypothetical protein